VAFHPGDLELVSGGATRRRMLLDRIALFLEPASVDDRQSYELALRQRQRALERSGPGGAESAAFEALVADHGVRVARARRISAEQLTPALERAFSRLAPLGIELAVRYVPGGTEDRELFGSELARRQSSDLRRGLATFGPHRDELELEREGRTARRHASQGQQRILTLALKLAELECVREARRAHPLLLLDDVSSELDEARTGAVYDLVNAEASQVFVTTTRPELLSKAALHPGERADFVIEAGVLRRA
jgi:DNA replication and repair protein RecF